MKSYICQNVAISEILTEKMRTKTRALELDTDIVIFNKNNQKSSRMIGNRMF
ncbi:MULTISPECIES: hypothetical protein [Helicobacter]|uniref:Uncharacterized protein n=1 Tax=Helicobacter ibis TaxID=2962633 RepID=A0ABT4VG54_9HELI|nr:MULTISPECIES: hypothetical protein [Helicobacter]MDA3968028.1 hypothetical protein [Helicobacter sp. WB40]MDA3969696.1 hypothetical protein [Helicobacter ibis]